VAGGGAQARGLQAPYAFSRVGLFGADHQDYRRRAGTLIRNCWAAA